MDFVTKQKQGWVGATINNSNCCSEDYAVHVLKYFLDSLGCGKEWLLRGRPGVYSKHLLSYKFKGKVLSNLKFRSLRKKLSSL